MRSSACFKFVIIFAFFSFTINAQIYPPPAGQPGTTAMYKDSSAFINWVTGCHVVRGYMDISNPSAGFASAGDSSMVLGVPVSNGVVSLGDGGYAVCTFQYPIKNGPGFDFAVFENSFDGAFLELAFVEVSSDGINFVRFASHSLTDTTLQTSSFGYTDATKINNLAGKYQVSYGTPFDLQELTGNSNLDINAITHIKVIDVVGSINKAYAKRDSYNNIINDPWPTGFPSGGFDLDAIGVIYQNTSVGIKENSLEKNIRIYPNPIAKGETLIINSSYEINSLTLFDFSGQKIKTNNKESINTNDLLPGIYSVQLNTVKGTITKKIIIK